MGCHFCEDIWNEKEYFEQSEFDMYDAIIKKEDGTHYIFSAVDDWYYNHIVVGDVKFCPCCGRKL